MGLRLDPVSTKTKPPIFSDVRRGRSILVSDLCFATELITKEALAPRQAETVMSEGQVSLHILPLSLNLAFQDKDSHHHCPQIARTKRRRPQKEVVGWELSGQGHTEGVDPEAGRYWVTHSWAELASLSLGLSLGTAGPGSLEPRLGLDFGLCKT